MLNQDFYDDDLDIDIEPDYWDDDDPAAPLDVPYRPAEIGDEELEPPRWTPRRVVYLLIALVILAALVVYLVLPLIDMLLLPPPPPPPTPPPALL